MADMMKDNFKESIDLSSIKEVKKVNLEKGDALVIETDEYIQDKAIDYIYREFKKIFPDNECIILEKIRAKAVLKKNYG